MFFFVAIMSDVYMIINFTSNLPSCLKIVKDVLSRKWNKEKKTKKKKSPHEGSNFRSSPQNVQLNTKFEFLFHENELMISSTGRYNYFGLHACEYFGGHILIHIL